MTILSKEAINDGYYYFVNGRRFNARARYILPSDEGESVRLLEQHFCFKILRNGNFIAPVKPQLDEGIQVLDSACGYGAPWTTDIAKEYPNSRFLGVDISDGFPVEDIASSNTTFALGNIAIKIPLPDNTLGFVFQRFLIGALSSEEWNSNLKEIHRVLKPGGFVELLEFIMQVLYLKHLQRMFQGFKNAGLVADISIQLNDRLKKIGFVGSVTTVQDFPLNNSHNGEANWRSLGGSFRGMGSLLAKVYTEWEDRGIYKEYMDNVEKELIEYKSYVKIYTVYAQKP
ncbi:hypothetical protein EDC94DRAFT_535548 [Helicostylum pulchrum]|nr:hypothetical protein EDC94DRAFT_535548 [Helicostylum pulchrum]